MTASNRWGVLARPWRRAAALAAALAAVPVVAVGVGAAPAQALGQRVNLRVLVVTNGDSASLAIATELDREGVPYTQVDLRTVGRPAITAAFLADAASGTGRYQAVVLPNQAGGGLPAAEVAALTAYETQYGVRQVNGYDFPTTAMGAVFSGVSGTLDGSPATVTAAGLAGAFGYLRGPLTIEDVDPAVPETFGYLANPDPALTAGRTFTPLVTATYQGSTGSILGAYAHDGREELVVTAAFNAYMQWFDTLAPGIVAWATRGIELGYHRNYFTVHVDDVFLPDSRWSASGNCTPGDNCVDPGVTTTDIRMTPADVTRLVTWQNASGMRLPMVFNGGGSEAAKTANGGVDPLTDAFLANKAAFPWINHTYTHPFLGCIQIAPTATTGTWHCATSATEQPRFDPDVAQAAGPDGVWYASQAYLTSAVGDNITWAQTNALPGFDPSVLVTGEHSALATLPQQPNDNPFLAPALAALGVTWTASDASRETDSRAVGTTTATVPRHPMNIFYNAGTYQDEVDEYNWIYTSAAGGGGGICEANPATSTCITPLNASTNAAAKTSFDSYIKPLEIRNALRFVLTNDPRPFYAHQSNLAEDGILYPVLDGILAAYQGIFDAAATPLVQADMPAAGQALTRMSAWKAATRAPGFADGYVDGAGVHLPSTSAIGTVAVPLTVPAGSVGTGLEPYGRSLSGWVGGGATVVPPTPAGGYALGAAAAVPGVPTAVGAVAGSGLVTVSWTAPATDGGSPITGYAVREYVGTSTTPAATLTAPAGATSLAVTGLVNGTSYRFDVAAVNAVGTGPASAPTAAVTPRAALSPVPTGVTGEAGNASATVRWTAPASTAGVTGYRVRALAGTTVARTVTVGAGQTVAAVPGLVNGTTYTFTVNTVVTTGTGTSQGPNSTASAPVTPATTAQTSTAPAVVGVASSAGSATVTWTAPAELAGTTPTSYRVRAYVAGTTTLARSQIVDVPATSATLTGLANGTAYQVEVTVQTVDGNGPTSARSAPVTPATSAPSAPVIGSASAGTAGGAITATARWSAPASTGGSSITGYVVTATRYGTAGEVLGQTSSPVLSTFTRSYVMTLPAVGSYRFTVVATNAVGSSPASGASNLVTGQ